MPVDDLAGAHENRFGGARLTGHEAQHPVHPVGEVDVGDSGFAEHRRRARRLTAERMGAGIAVAGIRLGFGDAHGDTAVREVRAEEVAGHVEDGTREELSRQAGHRMVGWLAAQVRASSR